MQQRGSKRKPSLLSRRKLRKLIGPGHSERNRPQPFRVERNGIIVGMPRGPLKPGTVQGP